PRTTAAVARSSRAGAVGGAPDLTSGAGGEAAPVHATTALDAGAAGRAAGLPRASTAPQTVGCPAGGADPDGGAPPGRRQVAHGAPAQAGPLRTAELAEITARLAEAAGAAAAERRAGAARAAGLPAAAA